MDGEYKNKEHFSGCALTKNEEDLLNNRSSFEFERGL